MEIIVLLLEPALQHIEIDEPDHDVNILRALDVYADSQGIYNVTPVEREAVFSFFSAQCEDLPRDPKFSTALVNIQRAIIQVAANGYNGYAGPHDRETWRTIGLYVCCRLIGQEIINTKTVKSSAEIATEHQSSSLIKTLELELGVTLSS